MLAFLVELNKRDPEAVVKHVDSGAFKVNSAVAVDYLKALVRTDKISQYSQQGTVRCVTCCCCLPDDQQAFGTYRTPLHSQQQLCSTPLIQEKLPTT